jgi:hypothetical protein
MIVSMRGTCRSPVTSLLISLNAATLPVHFPFGSVGALPLRKCTDTHGVKYAATSWGWCRGSTVISSVTAGHHARRGHAMTLLLLPPRAKRVASNGTRHPVMTPTLSYDQESSVRYHTHRIGSNRRPRPVKCLQAPLCPARVKHSIRQTIFIPRIRLDIAPAQGCIPHPGCGAVHEGKEIDGTRRMGE